MQRFSAVLCHEDRGAELQAGAEILGYRVRLYHMHHVFLQRPFFQRMRRGTCSQLGALAGFAVKDAVVSGEAVLFDDRSSGDDFLAGSAGFANLAHVLVALQRHVEQFSINRGRFAPDGERAMDLRRVAPETNGQFGDDHTPHADGARRGALPWNKAVGIIHLRRRDEMNSGLAAVLEVGAIYYGQDILLGHAGPELSL